MGKPKELFKEEAELTNAVSKFELSTKRALKRISKLKQYESLGSKNEEEIEAFKTTGDWMLRRSKENSEVNLPAILSSAAPEGSRGETDKPTRKSIKEMMEQLERDQGIAETLHKDLDRCEVNLRIYNIPKRIAGRESLEEYLKRVREYKAKYRKLRMKNLREKGNKKCMVYWIVELGKSSNGRATSNTLKDVLVGIGTKISHFLIDYFVLVANSANPFGKREISDFLYEVEAVIKSLRVYDDANSVVIDRFVSLVLYARKMMMESRKFDDDDDDIAATKRIVRVKNSLVLEKENDLFHLIALQIQMLELCFMTPKYSDMLQIRTYDMIGKKLVDDVFKDKLSKISEKIRKMKNDPLFLCGDKSEVVTYYEEALYLGIKDNVWDKIDLNPKVQD